nr:MAG TPA: hypothetical protein [Caudoviricetes sp.]
MRLRLCFAVRLRCAVPAFSFRPLFLSYWSCAITDERL